LTSVHRPYDTRIFQKECVSATKEFDVYLIALKWISEIRSGVNIIGVPFSSTSRFVRATFGVFKVYLAAIKLDAAIYHIHDPELIPLGILLKRRGKIVIFDAHEDLPEQIMYKHYIPNFFRKILSKCVAFIEILALKRFNFIFSATPTINAKFIRKGMPSSSLCNYPILSYDDTISNIRNKDVLYMGGVSIARGIVQLNAAMKEVLALKPSIHFYIAGMSHPENLIQEYDDQWKKSKSIHFLGMLSRTELNVLLADSKIGLVNFLPNKAHLDALPNKMFEYMEAGIPIVASNFPFWKGIIEKHKCGICIDPTNPSQIADAIIYLLDHPDLAIEMGKNGRKAVLEEFNWLTQEKELLKVYNELVSV